MENEIWNKINYYILRPRKVEQNSVCKDTIYSTNKTCCNWRGRQYKGLTKAIRLVYTWLLSAVQVDYLQCAACTSNRQQLDGSVLAGDRRVLSLTDTEYKDASLEIDFLGKCCVMGLHNVYFIENSKGKKNSLRHY
jgi:hypothetical protein